MQTQTIQNMALAENCSIDFFADFSVIAWKFNIKFYTQLRTHAKQNSTNFNDSEVTEVLAWQTIIA